jgi:hypothetical protein
MFNFGMLDMLSKIQQIGLSRISSLRRAQGLIGASALKLGQDIIATEVSNPKKR